IQPLVAKLKQVSTGTQIKTAIQSAQGNAISGSTGTTATHYPAAVLSDNPLEYYRFEDTLYLGWDQQNPMTDSSGNGRNGVYNGTHCLNVQPGAPIGITNYSNSFSASPSGGAYAYMDGTGGILNFYDGSGDLPFTFEAWVNTSSSGAAVATVQPIVSR